MNKKTDSVNQRLNDIERETRHVRNSIKAVSKEMGRTGIKYDLERKADRTCQTRGRIDRHRVLFMNYLSSTDFPGNRSLKDEKSVQKNKAIFMLIVVSITCYVVINLLNH
ncbi:MAG: hypothetical protein GKR87_05285 [Kiritimatiellae bacterium]|nr:hypothetical protein [Kiritimatiellia bacterium]